jgi:hypothetical protein
LREQEKKIQKIWALSPAGENFTTQPTARIFLIISASSIPIGILDKNTPEIHVK